MRLSRWGLRPVESHGTRELPPVVGAQQCLLGGGHDVETPATDAGDQASIDALVGVEPQRSADHV
ncbi:MAG: hypothetical protein ACRELA_20160 [Candidatus Rokuibacteriota bacterium]